MNSTLYIYTDGSSNPRTKEGGWAFCVTDNPKSKNVIHRDYGWHGGTTNNRMELTSVINALEYAYFNYNDTKKLIVYSDSEYVSNPIYLGWLNEWRKSNWIKSDGQETKNSDLWETMWQILKRFKFRKIQVEVCWVKAHNGQFFNEECDRMAKHGRYQKITNKNYE